MTWMTIICRECYMMVGGLPAGDVVRWTVCERCAQKALPTPPTGEGA